MGGGVSNSHLPLTKTLFFRVHGKGKPVQAARHVLVLQRTRLAYGEIRKTQDRFYKISPCGPYVRKVLFIDEEYARVAGRFPLFSRFR